MKRFPFFLLALLLLSSCVSKKKFNELKADCENQQLTLRTQITDCESRYSGLQGELNRRNNDLSARDAELAAERSRIRTLEQQLEDFKATNTNLLQRPEDLAVVSKTGAENIKKSLEAINEQGRYIKDLTTSIQRKDSLNLLLVTNLKRSLANINDEDVTIEVKKGVVYISLSDKMLFKSGSADINPSAQTVLGKIATVVNDHKDFDILVEGHTDNVPILSIPCVKDNWDLSVKRSVEVVRMLQEKFNVKPERMTAGGRSFYVPKTTNDNENGRSLNRRTEIIILPKLDQFFALLEKPEGEAQR